MKPRNGMSANSKEKENKQLTNNRPPLHQDLLNLIVNKRPNYEGISQILQSKICKVEKRESGEYFKFDFKRQNICDRIKFLQQNQQDDENLNKTEQFKQLYKVGSKVGQGAYASVRVAIDLKTQNKVAIKIYEKNKIKDIQRRKGVRREIEILERLNHRNIVRILDTIESNNHVNIILEYVSGNSLHHFLKRHNERRIDEETAKTLFKQIVEAIRYCHSQQIVHRDIKLENILMDGLTPKLIDFGFSTSFPLDKKVKMFCGTPSYMAPEIVSRIEYRGDKADVWALGVVLFIMLQGVFPFKGDSDTELYNKIKSGEFTLFHNISKEAIALIYGMLTVDADMRPSCEELLDYAWFRRRKDHSTGRENRESRENRENSNTNTSNTNYSKEREQYSKIPDNLREDLDKYVSYVTPTNQGKQFYFDFSYLKSKQKPVIPKPSYFTTTNAQAQQKEPQFFKVERQATLSREKCLSKERQSSYSFESSRGLSQKKMPHQLTVHPSYIPSEKSFNNYKSPAGNDRRSFNFFYN